MRPLQRHNPEKCSVEFCFWPDSATRCKKAVVWPVVILCLLSFFQHGHSDELANLHIRRVYTDEDAPQAIRFRHLLLMLSVDIDGARERASRRLKKMGFDVADVPRIRAYLDSLNEQAQAEIDEGIWRLACQSTASELDGLEIRVVYNSFDDLRYAVAAKFLAIASAELASMGYPDFQYMISQYPGDGASFKTISTDHRYVWGDSSDGIRQNRAELCRNLGERLGRYFE